MFTGATFAFLSRRILFSSEYLSHFPFNTTPKMLADYPLPHLFAPTVCVLLSAAVLYHTTNSTHSNTDKKHTKEPISVLKIAISYICSLLFGTGLAISGMTQPDRVLNFLDFSRSDGWDPTLMGVMGGGVIVTMIGFYIMKVTNPLTVCRPHPVGDNIHFGKSGHNTKIDGKLLTGTVVFGAGWGMLGACPGPAIVAFGGGSPLSAVFVPAMLLGFMIHSDYLY